MPRSTSLHRPHRKNSLSIRILTLISRRRSTMASRRGYDSYIDEYGRPIPMNAYLPTDFARLRRPRDRYRSYDWGRRVVDVSDPMNYEQEFGGIGYGDFDLRPAFDIPAYGERRPSLRDARRSMGNRKLDGLPARSGLMDEFRDLRLRPRPAGPMRETVKFGMALTKLFRQLEKAETCFTEFKTEFDMDIMQVRQYASQAVVSQLWNMKVDPKGCLPGSPNMDEDEAMREKGRKFGEWKEKLGVAFEEALNSTYPEGGKNRARLESANRLRQKVDVARDQILDLLNLAPRERDHCGSLVRELTLLKTAISPDEGSNKDLYKDSGCDEGDGEEGKGAGGDAGDWGN